MSCNRERYDCESAGQNELTKAFEEKCGVEGGTESLDITSTELFYSYIPYICDDKVVKDLYFVMRDVLEDMRDALSEVRDSLRKQVRLLRCASLTSTRAEYPDVNVNLGYINTLIDVFRGEMGAFRGQMGHQCGAYYVGPILRVSECRTDNLTLAIDMLRGFLQNCSGGRKLVVFDVSSLRVINQVQGLAVVVNSASEFLKATIKTLEDKRSIVKDINTVCTAILAMTKKV